MENKDKAVVRASKITLKSKFGEKSDQVWYLTKGDSTHFYLSNSPDFKGSAYHVGQFRQDPYYNDVVKWLHGEIKIDGKEYQNIREYAEGGGVDKEVYIDFLNKKKNFQQDRKYFKGKDAYQQAVKWAKKNFERFDPDMIKHDSSMAKGGGVEDFWKFYDGTEISSLEFEGVVYVDGKNKVLFMDGEKIKPTTQQIEILKQEAFEGEGGFEGLMATGGEIWISPHVKSIHNYIMKAYGFLISKQDIESYTFSYSDFADEIKKTYDLSTPRNKVAYDYLKHLGNIPMFSGKEKDMEAIEQRMSTADVPFEKGGGVENDLISWKQIKVGDIIHTYSSWAYVTAKDDDKITMLHFWSYGFSNELGRFKEATLSKKMFNQYSAVEKDKDIYQLGNKTNIQSVVKSARWFADHDFFSDNSDKIKLVEKYKNYPEIKYIYQEIKKNGGLKTLKPQEVESILGTEDSQFNKGGIIESIGAFLNKKVSPEDLFNI